MMKYKILTPDEDGKFIFTKEELEKLLDEVYQEGFDDGKKITITTPSAPASPWVVNPYNPVIYADKTAPTYTTTTWMKATGKGEDVLL